jgi:RNA polymerase sigma factor (sigma-70 family)
MTQTPHPDQQYIDALLSNDSIVLDEMYKKYSGKIKNMIVQNNGTATDAADIFQEALLAIYQKAKQNSFVLTCPLDAYLYLICKNRWINELKKRSSKVTFSDTEGYNLGEDSFKDAEVTMNGQERKKLLEMKFKELGEGCRKVLQLSWSGKTMEEVAQALNNTYGYIRKKKSECMAKLIALVKQSPQYTQLQW